MSGTNRLIKGIVAWAGILAALSAAALRAAGPAVSLSPSTLSFPSQLATTTSAPQTLTLTNVGNQPLTISSITLQGTFGQTNNCPTSSTVAAGASCTFMVTFVAPNGGPTVQPGFIEVQDNALPGIQAINLSGTVADFALTSSPTSSTVSKGSSATYTITVTPSGGFNQAVSLTCGSLPTGAACSFSPASVTPSSGPATAKLSVSTTALVPLAQRNNPGIHTSPWTEGILLLVLAGLLALRKCYGRVRKLACYSLAAALLALALGIAGCGGGGTYNGEGNLITPAGTYTVLITGSPTSGPSSLSNPLSVTLVVQ